MSFARQSCEHVFPHDYERVFSALVAAVERCGFKSMGQDKNIGSVTASVGMSAFSWGEKLSFNVYRVNESSTAVAISSALNVGVNIGGAHRHQGNFDAVIRAMGVELARSDLLRTWTDNTGKHNVPAYFVEVRDSFVKLQKQDGSFVSVPWNRMCEADCEWVRKHVEGS